jgi:hypothetical protein
MSGSDDYGKTPSLCFLLWDKGKVPLLIFDCWIKVRRSI